MERIRICELITELQPGGAERSVYELARRLDRDRFDVQVVALRGGPVADRLAEAGVRTTVLGVRGKWDVGKLRALAGLLREARIDILHTHLFHADLAGRPAAAMASVPHLVHTVRTAEGRFRPWQFAFARLMGGRCERLICVSPGVRDWHARKSGLPLGRYTVIPNGIDIAACEPSAEARRRLRDEWGVGDDDALIAFVGRLHMEKGIDILLGAMSHLSARGEPRCLVIAGDGPERTMVETFVSHGEGGGQCRWLGFREDVRDVLSAADLFVMPSRWEGWPLAIGEAMAVGLPVLATDVPGTRDIIADGRTGVLVAREDVVALADGLERLAGDADLRARLAAAGREYVREHCTIGATVAAHEKLYLELMGE